MPNYQTLHEPFGFEQGDPLIVCLSLDHMKQVIKAFKIKAHYVEGWRVRLGGRRYSKIIVFSPTIMDLNTKERYKHWKQELRVHLGPEDIGNIYFV